MISLKKLSFVMEWPTVYRLWQAPFYRAKFEPILRHNDMQAIRRVLDVGCGPGTNAPVFQDLQYVGLDMNPRYIELAQRRYKGTFITADARTYVAPPGAKFDFILLNSLLHHIDTENVSRILKQLAGQLTEDGHVHILDLVLPESRGISRFLAKADRGDHPRAMEAWKELFEDAFEPVVMESYGVGWFGRTFWQMVYFKGRAKS